MERFGGFAKSFDFACKDLGELPIPMLAEETSVSHKIRLYYIVSPFL